MKILIFYSFLSIGYIMVWLQIYGANKFPIIKNNDWFFVYTIAPLIAYFMVEGSRSGYVSMDSWSVRLISFSINMVISALLTYFILNESLTVKNSICLILSFVIILIQILWK